MIEIVVAAFLVLGAALLSLWWARASHRGTLPQNLIFGYRTPLTLSDEAAWIAINRAPARFVAAGGIGAASTSVLALVSSLLGFGSVAPGLLGFGLVWLLVCTTSGIVPARRAARRYAAERS